MVYCISSRFYSEELSHLKDRSRLSWGWAYCTVLLGCIDIGICHGRCSSVSPGWVHQSFFIYSVHLIEFFLSHSVLEARNLTIEVAKDGFDWSSWSKWQSIGMIE